MAKKLEGGCFCGAVRYRLLDAPIVVNCCHCTKCQRQTGSAFVINAVIEESKLERRGAIDVVPTFARGEYQHDIHRCKKCKVAVWSDYGRGPFRFVRVGTLDKPSALRPDVHIFTRSKQPWVELPRNVPAYAEGYDRESLLSPAKLARRDAAIEAWKARKAGRRASR